MRSGPVTTVGMNVRDSRNLSVTTEAAGLSASNLSLLGASSYYNTESGAQSATLGGYAREELQFNDRLFLAGAVRVDAASGFGKDYQTATYPKLSLSWLAVQTARTTVRFPWCVWRLGGRTL